MMVGSQKVDIIKYLSQFSGKTIYFHPNPGNAGDALINLGCYDTFNKLKINVITINYKTDIDVSNSVVVLGGGGGFVPEWSVVRKVVEKYHQKAKKLIILPQTIVGNEDLISQFSDNVTVFARELVTYSYLLRVAPRCVDVKLAEDMALNVNIENALTTPGYKFNPRKKIKEWCIKQKYKKTKSKNCLDAFRVDKEKSEIEIPEGNIDVSLVFALGTDTQKNCQRSVYNFLNYLNQFEIVNTNRLHVCVGAALLGKEVNFYNNGYFKCKAMYEISLKDRFSKVKWNG